MKSLNSSRSLQSLVFYKRNSTSRLALSLSLALSPALTFNQCCDDSRLKASVKSRISHFPRLSEVVHLLQLSDLHLYRLQHLLLHIHLSGQHQFSPNHNLLLLLPKLTSLQHQLPPSSSLLSRSNSSIWSHSTPSISSSSSSCLTSSISSHSTSSISSSLSSHSTSSISSSSLSHSTSSISSSSSSCSTSSISSSSLSHSTSPIASSSLSHSTFYISSSSLSRSTSSISSSSARSSSTSLIFLNFPHLFPFSAASFLPSFP